MARSGERASQLAKAVFVNAVLTFAGTAALTNHFMPAVLADFHAHHPSAEIQMTSIQHGASVEEERRDRAHEQVDDVARVPDRVDVDRPKRQRVLGDRRAHHDEEVGEEE